MIGRGRPWDGFARGRSDGPFTHELREVRSGSIGPPWRALAGVRSSRLSRGSWKGRGRCGVRNGRYRPISNRGAGRSPSRLRGSKLRLSRRRIAQLSYTAIEGGPVDTRTNLPAVAREGVHRPPPRPPPPGGEALGAGAVAGPVPEVEDDALAEAALADLEGLAEQLGDLLQQQHAGGEDLHPARIELEAFRHLGRRSAERTRMLRSSVSYSSTAPTRRRRLVAEPPTATACAGRGISTPSKKSSMWSRTRRISAAEGGSEEISSSARTPEPTARNAPCRPPR